jgi:hypothetical protein
VEKVACVIGRIRKYNEWNRRLEAVFAPCEGRSRSLQGTPWPTSNGRLGVPCSGPDWAGALPGWTEQAHCLVGVWKMFLPRLRSDCHSRTPAYDTSMCATR